MTIQPAELKQRLDSDSKPLILDVRTPAEFKEMAIADSKSMPLDQLDAEAVKQMAPQGGGCVVVCYSGKRSDQACAKLKEAGLDDVCSLQGGLELWERMQLPLRKHEKAGFSIIRQVHIVAGLLVLSGTILAATVSPWWAILPGFVGAGLAFAGLTGFCGMALILAKMPWNRV